MAGRFDTSLLVVLAMAAVNRLVEDWVVGRRLLLLTGVVVDSLFKSLMLPFSELEKTPLDSVPVDVAICSSLLLFSLTCLLLGDTRSNRLPSDDFILCQSGGLDMVVTVFELILDNVRSFVTETDDTRALVLLVATTRELTSFLSPVCWTARAVGGRIALSLMELLEGTALLMRTGSELLLGLLGFKGTTATPTTARRLDIVSSSGEKL